ncbi:MAG: NBR1-Ig-like domain-containing protein, partial [Chloroflexota bacterium]
MLLTALLSACGEQAAVNNPDYYLPPTLSHHPTEIPLATPTEIQPTATPYCENDLTFIEDVNYPDNTEVTPGTLVDKIWLVENSGTCSWDSQYRIRFVEG